MFLRPNAYVFKVPTYMSCVEVNVSLGISHCAALPPHLSKDPNVDCTHQLLPEDVKAVSWVCVSIDGFVSLDVHLLHLLTCF